MFTDLVNKKLRFVCLFVVCLAKDLSKNMTERLDLNEFKVRSSTTIESEVVLKNIGLRRWRKKHLLRPKSLFNQYFLPSEKNMLQTFQRTRILVEENYRNVWGEQKTYLMLNKTHILMELDVCHIVIVQMKNKITYLTI